MRLWVLAQLRPFGYMITSAVTFDEQYHFSRFHGNIRTRVILFPDAGDVSLKNYLGLSGLLTFLDRVYSNEIRYSILN